MKLFKKTAIAAVLSVASAASFAMTPMHDEGLSQVAGQDGVSIAASLNVNIGEFKYTDTDAAGGSVSFHNIAVKGTVAATIDVINAATFQVDTFGSVLGVLNPLDPANAGIAAAQGAALAAFYPSGSDVVKVAVPNIAVDSAHGLSMSVASITMGNSTKSFGSFAMNDIKLQGTTAYIWAH
ncbi:hypothetical protein EGT07_22795 [Herbaspirillum sp. HC18]|nr:hypothetical protein EGT07_22795 [Herbaspirillum sp. HC18]